MSDPGPEVWLEDDGVLRIQYPQNFDLTLVAAQAIFEQSLMVARRSSPVLVYADTLVSADYDAQRFASHAAVVDAVSGMAIVVKSYFSKALVDLFMRFHKPPYPVQVFADEQPALDWLEQFVPRGGKGVDCGNGDTGG